VAESSEATSETAESSDNSEISESSELQSEASAEPSSAESEAQSEETSIQQSEEPSSEESSNTGDVPAINPWEGTDIKPAEGKVIAFTFDDGPSYTKSTEKILDKLEELGMKATFFMVGERVSAGTAPIIKRMVELGCDIGNHSYDHPNFNSMTTAQVKKQIDDTNAKLEKFAGVKATLIRPPYGNIKDSQMAALNTPIICWDIDSLDWDLRNAQKIYDRTIAKVHSGGIVLMHDIYDTTAEAFCMLADKLVADGYTLVSISELLGTDKLMCTTIKYGFKW
jgi:peptidoglycan/xylan/chitin deacetylase (PgdA/CDA1 family)